MHILVCGGAGYIGSHTVVELLAKGFDITIVDNLCNARREVLGRIEKIAGRSFCFVEADVRDMPAMELVMASARFDAVIHFAALKAVGESVSDPLSYFDNNVSGTISLLRTMRRAGVGCLVFSSSATVYGMPESCPVREDAPLSVTNPYGRTKLIMEDIIGDVSAADAGFKAVVLRYFNPAGAHPSGLLGEDPNGTPSNLMPYISRVATGCYEYVNVFGDDYLTPDGTGVRDFIHIVDLAKAHVAAIEFLHDRNESLTVNLGTGRGYSVMEMIRTFERAAGRDIPYRVVARRPGDVAECYADPSLAREKLGWSAIYGIDEMCADEWRWATGYAFRHSG